MKIQCDPAREAKSNNSCTFFDVCRIMSESFLLFDLSFFFLKKLLKTSFCDFYIGVVKKPLF